MIEEISFETCMNDIYPLTERVAEIITGCGISEGICVLHIPHTTAGLCITSKWDETGFADIKSEMRRIVPTRVDFHHQFDTPEDAAGHIKSVLTGCTMQIIVYEGKPLLGSSQGIYFLEFDGPRKRTCYIKIYQC